MLKGAEGGGVHIVVTLQEDLAPNVLHFHFAPRVAAAAATATSARSSASASDALGCNGEAAVACAAAVGTRRLAGGRAEHGLWHTGSWSAAPSFATVDITSLDLLAMWYRFSVVCRFRRV